MEIEMNRGLTKVVGIASVLLACFVSTAFGEEDRVTPLSPLSTPLHSAPKDPTQNANS